MIRYAVLVVSISIFQIGCNSNPEKPIGVESPMVKSDSPFAKSDLLALRNWVALDIKFKPGTTDEVKERAIKAIENIITDTVNKLRNGSYPNFAPNFTRTTNQWVDASLVNLRISFYSKDTIMGGGCPNPCQNKCGVCATILNNLIIDPQGPISNKFIEKISSPADDKIQ